MRRWKAGLEAYRNYLCGISRTPDTVENALAALRVFERFCLEREIHPLQPPEPAISAYIGWLRTNRALSTVRNRLVQLKLFFTWLEREDWIKDNPTSNIKAPTVRPTPIQPYQLSDLQKLQAALRTPRDHAMFLLYVGTGLRLSEIRQLRVNQVDHVAGTIRVRGKGGKEVLRCPGHRAMAALRVYMAIARITEGWIFPGRNRDKPLTRNSVYYWVRALAKRAGVSAANVHRFRHTFGHEFLRAGGSLEELNVLLAHNKVETTIRYITYGLEERAREKQRRLSLADRL